LYPWWRLLGICAGFLAAPKVPLFSTTRVRVRVWPSELDYFLHVNNGRYLTLADLGRLDLVVRTDVMAAMRAHRAVPVVAEAIAKFRRELKLFQTFEIHTRILGWNDKWAFVEHRFLRVGRVIGVVVARTAFKSATGLVSPIQLLETMGKAVTSPPLPDWVEHFQSSADRLIEVLRDEERSQGLR
jgi:acyl-CoA thioesterase FadM